MRPCSYKQGRFFLTFRLRRAPLSMAAVSQLVQRAQVFHREPGPPLPVTARPQIAGQAAGKALAPIVDLDKLLPAVMAMIHATSPRFGRHPHLPDRFERRGLIVVHAAVKPAITQPIPRTKP